METMQGKKVYWKYLAPGHNTPVVYHRTLSDLENAKMPTTILTNMVLNLLENNFMAQAANDDYYEELRKAYSFPEEDQGKSDPDTEPDISN
jgi:hypothetical protein